MQAPLIVAIRVVRALLHVVLAAALCVSGISIGSPVGREEHSVQIAAFANSSAVLLQRAGSRVDHPRQAGNDTPVILAPPGGSTGNRGQSEKITGVPAPILRWFARTNGGRSPPLAIF